MTMSRIKTRLSDYLQRDDLGVEMMGRIRCRLSRDSDPDDHDVVRYGFSVWPDLPIAEPGYALVSESEVWVREGSGHAIHDAIHVAAVNLVGLRRDVGELNLISFMERSDASDLTAPQDVRATRWLGILEDHDYREFRIGCGWIASRFRVFLSSDVWPRLVCESPRARWDAIAARVVGSYILNCEGCEVREIDAREIDDERFVAAYVNLVEHGKLEIAEPRWSRTVCTHLAEFARRSVRVGASDKALGVIRELERSNERDWGHERMTEAYECLAAVHDVRRIAKSRVATEGCTSDALDFLARSESSATGMHEAVDLLVSAIQDCARHYERACEEGETFWACLCIVAGEAIDRHLSVLGELDEMAARSMREEVGRIRAW